MTSQGTATERSFDCDVIVIGGGPAGTTAATELARRGRSVMLFEKDRHPRFHIGESLLPMNMPILERLGVLPDVARIGVRKQGADFPGDNERGFNVFDFARNPQWVPAYAYQVKRAEFDEILLRNAQRSGVTVCEDTEVVEAGVADSAVNVRVRKADGGTREIRGRYLVDASGRGTLLGTQWKLKQRHAGHRSAAVFAHFTGVERRSEPYAGNISIYRFHLGWVWVIPLTEDVTSIGAVCLPEVLKRREGGLESFLMSILDSVPRLKQRMAHATLRGNLEATGNYSYACRDVCGPRWIMVGDAGAFIDPVFSSGVYIAMHSAERAATLIDSVLSGASERRLQRTYGRDMRAGLRTFSWFIVRFRTPALEWLFANPRNVLGVENAVIAMLSGHVFDARSTLRRLRLFKLLYYVTSLRMWRHTLRHRRAMRSTVAS
jgi:flavin-dependent dehydrogenase